MGFIQHPTPGSPTIGLFAPCDPRIDDASRERCLNIVTMTARIVQGVRLPMGETLGIFVADEVVQGEADADRVAQAFKQAGVEAICIVPDTWFYPGRTAMALTAHFPRTTPICCLAGNNAPKPGVVGVDAAVGAYAQTGLLCHAIIGTMPETGMDPEFEDDTKAQILDLVWAMVAAVWLRGKRVMCADIDIKTFVSAVK